MTMDDDDIVEEDLDDVDNLPQASVLHNLDKRSLFPFAAQYHLLVVLLHYVLPDLIVSLIKVESLPRFRLVALGDVEMFRRLVQIEAGQSLGQRECNGYQEVEMPNVFSSQEPGQVVSDADSIPDDGGEEAGSTHSGRVTSGSAFRQPHRCQ